MEAAKLECSREELSGVKRARNVQMVAAGTGEALPAEAQSSGMIMTAS
jgi:hypothetical protein